MLIFDILLQGLFWGSVIALVHSYAFYPVLVRWLAERKRRTNSTPLPTPTAESETEELPYLVVAIAAHNEELVIRETLESLFRNDYPEDRLEIIVAADNCSDRTVDIVRSFSAAHPNLTLKEFPGRNGKIRVINQVIAENRPRWSREHPDFVLMLCDANVRWTPELPRRLAHHFSRSQIGQVAPVILDSREQHHGIADYEEAYVNRENGVKQAEGELWGRMMGAFGACYAIRGRLFEPVPENFVVDDFYHTMRCFELGFDAIIEPKAVCFEDVSEDISEEFRRKRRIAIGNFQNLGRFWSLLSKPLQDFGTFFAFWSHKGIRWFGPFLLGIALLTSAALAPTYLIYALAFAGQIALMAVAALDAGISRRGIHLKLPRAIRYFYLMNVALFLGAVRFFRGVESNVWEPTRRVAPAEVPVESHASLPLSSSPSHTTPAPPARKPKAAASSSSSSS